MPLYAASLIKTFDEDRWCVLHMLWGIPVRANPHAGKPCSFRTTLGAAKPSEGPENQLEMAHVALGDLGMCSIRWKNRCPGVIVQDMQSQHAGKGLICWTAFLTLSSLCSLLLTAHWVMRRR